MRPSVRSSLVSAILIISGGAALLTDCTRDMHMCEIQQQVWSMLLTQAGGLKRVATDPLLPDGVWMRPRPHQPCGTKC